MTALETLAIALAGGSIGSVLTLLSGVGEAIRHHNRQARGYDDDLAQWVADECVSLERALNRHRNEAASEGRQYDGSYLRGIAHIKEDFLHRYRDQQREAESKLAALRDSEGLRHRVWRWVRRMGPLPALTTPQTAEPVLAGWRAEVRVQGVGTTPVSDPTRRPLIPWAVDKYGEIAPGNDPPER